MTRPIPLLALTLLGCQAKAQDTSAPEPAQVEVRDGAGTVIAQLRPGHPCRATIGPVELLVGGPPLVAQLGETRWSGEDGTNGTTISRDGAAVARLYPLGDKASEDVIDPQGIALARVSVTGDTATVTNAGGQVLRRLTLTGSTITVDTPKLSVAGTTDMVLAALLSAPELVPEVRMLAACERVLGARGS